MSWQEKAKKYIRETYHRTAHKIVEWGGSLLMLLPGTGAAQPIPDAVDSSKKTDVTETVAGIRTVKSADVFPVSEFSSGYDRLCNPDLYQPIECLDVEKAAEQIAGMTLGELLEKNLVSVEEIRNYQFTADDFKQMKPGRLGNKMYSYLVKKYPGKPQSRCGQAGREAFAAATSGKYNIWTSTGRVCDWSAAVAGTDAPLVCIGKVEVDRQTLQDRGNVRLADLRHVQRMPLVFSGNPEAEIAGHWTLPNPQYDEKGNYVGNIARTDGAENFDRIIARKVGGGKNHRYGNVVEILAPTDVKPSRGLARFIIENMTERSSNAVEICRLIDQQGNGIEKYLKPSYAILAQNYLEPHSRFTQEQRISAARQRLHGNGETGQNALALQSDGKGRSGMLAAAKRSAGKNDSKILAAAKVRRDGRS